MGLRAWEYAKGGGWEWVAGSGSMLRVGMGLRAWEYAKGWGWEWVAGSGSTLRAGGGNGSQGLGVR